MICVRVSGGPILPHRKLLFGRRARTEVRKANFSGWAGKPGCPPIFGGILVLGEFWGKCGPRPFTFSLASLSRWAPTFLSRSGRMKISVLLRGDLRQFQAQFQGRFQGFPGGKCMPSVPAVFDDCRKLTWGRVAGLVKRSCMRCRDGLHEVAPRSRRHFHGQRGMKVNFVLHGNSICFCTRTSAWSGSVGPCRWLGRAGPLVRSPSTSGSP